MTSISCGLVMTMVGLFSKAACLNLYAWVHTHYRSGVAMTVVNGDMVALSVTMITYTAIK